MMKHVSLQFHMYSRQWGILYQFSIDNENLQKLIYVIKVEFIELKFFELNLSHGYYEGFVICIGISFVIDVEILLKLNRRKKECSPIFEFNEFSVRVDFS